MSIKHLSVSFKRLVSIFNVRMQISDHIRGSVLIQYGFKQLMSIPGRITVGLALTQHLLRWEADVPFNPHKDHKDQLSGLGL
ncbi:MAG: hypothetical protein Kow00121_03150 [Elainellaceae cyanobacterium]